MLTAHERSVAVRALSLAYRAYRNLSIRDLCRKEGIFIEKDPGCYAFGLYRSLSKPQLTLEETIGFDFELERYHANKAWRWAKKQERHLRRWFSIRSKYDHHITLSPKMPHVFKHLVFWHEVGHLILRKLQLFPGFVGYHAYLYEFTHDHWEHERLAEAFALAMVLYQSGLEPIMGDRESFFFADESSLTYEQMMRCDANRIAWYCLQARQQGTNLNLSALDELEAHLRKSADGAYGVQLIFNFPTT